MIGLSTTQLFEIVFSKLFMLANSEDCSMNASKQVCGDTNKLKPLL